MIKIFFIVLQIWSLTLNSTGDTSIGFFASISNKKFDTALKSGILPFVIVIILRIL